MSENQEIRISAWEVVAVALLLIVAMAMIAVGVANGQTVCCGPTGKLWTCADAVCANPVAVPCSSVGRIVEASACAATVTPTPAPTATPSAAATPTPAPALAYTVTQFLAPSDLGATYTYLQAPRVLEAGDHTYLTLNGGNCCPAIGDGIGECAVFIDYSTATPWWREFFCTNRDTSDLWETSSGEMALLGGALTLWGDSDYRPAVGALQGAWKDMFLWHTAIPYPVLPVSVNATGIQRFAGWHPDRMLLPQGLLRLGGEDYLYAMSFQGVGVNYTRFLIDTGMSLERPLPPGQPIIQPLFSGIAIDADGSLIATTDDAPPVASTTGKLRRRLAAMEGRLGWWPSQDSNTVHVWRSFDLGVTWKNTGITITSPAGHTLFGCSFVHANWGGAVQPWVLVCSIGTGKGPDTGDWGLAVVTTGTATVPANMLTKPVAR